MKTARVIAAGLLVASAAASVGLALMGADRALEAMKYHAACAVLASVIGFSVWALVRSCRRRMLAAGLLHAGFACVLAGWLAGLFLSPAEGSLQLRRGQIGQVADVGELALEDFTIDYWEDTGTVRQYTSRVTPTVYPSDPAAAAVPSSEVAIQVNHPFVFRRGFFDPGWWIYQNSYQEATNPHTGAPFYFTIFLCVKDVGLPLVAFGGVLLLLGALVWARATLCLNVGLQPPSAARCRRPIVWLYGLAFLGAAAMLVHRGLSTGHAPMQNMYEFLMCTAAFLPILTYLARRERHALVIDAALQALVLVPVAFFMDGRVKHLMPALQSPLFVPHVGAYVLGYVVLVRAAFGVGRRLTGVGFLLLTIGLVLGSVWGKVCWGHWWQFDPKEMWSLATWFAYAAYYHVRPRLTAKGENVFLAVGAAMIVLTLTWINLSRLFTGMHSYA